MALPVAQVNVTALPPTPASSGPRVRNGWTDAAGPYFYGTKEVSVATTDHDWLFVAVSWEGGEDSAVAYCADNAHNTYRQCAVTPPGTAVSTQVFCVPNAKAANTVYVSTSAYVRWLTVCILDVAGLQAGFTIDASSNFSGGPAAAFTMSLSTAQPDFILAAGAFGGTPGTITQSGSGATWTGLYGGINGSASDGITQAASWAATTGAASPSMQYTGPATGFYSGCMVAVYAQGALPVNSNPAWPVTNAYVAFGYTPNEPTVPPAWTDITSRYLGLSGPRGRSFELDEIAAADITPIFDNFDGALSPQNSASPYYPGVTLITPVWITKTWQGRTSTLFRGIIHALPQTYDYQRGMVKAAVSDDFSKLPQILLPTCMIQEMLYDKPLDLWPLNEQQGAVQASNWSSRSNAALTPTPAQFTLGRGGTVPSVRQTFNIFGKNFPVFSVPSPNSAVPGGGSSIQAVSAGPAPTPTTPTTGFGNSNTGIYPAGLAGTQDSVWGNTSAVTATNYYQGTALVDSHDTTLPLTSTGATYSVRAQMYFVPVNTSAIIMALSDQNGPAGGKNYLTLAYDGTHVTVSQTAGSTQFTPPAFLFDSNWHTWAVTVSPAGLITVYLDGSVLGTLTGTFPSGTPTMLQWGGDVTATTAGTAGLFTGCMSLAGAYDRVVDPERILTWHQSAATGFLDELGGTRIQRVLAWARWSAPQAVDPGITKQQQFNYLTGGYGSNGVTGAIGNYATAGGAAGAASGAQADATLQDIASTETGFLFMTADGTLAFRSRNNMPGPLAALGLGDMDNALNRWQTFEGGLGPWTQVSSCTVTRSAGWSYAGKHSALMTVTGTPVQAYAWGDSGAVTPGQQTGFSCWLMSPQGCTATLSIDFYNAGAVYISTSSLPAPVNCPPVTPVFLNLAGVAAPAGAATAYPHPTIVSSPATGTQLYFDRARLSPTGFQCPYMDDVEITEDIQYLFNDVVITRNVDQATYRARDATSRNRYYPRVYTRTIYSSVNDPNAVVNAANTLLTAFSSPALRVTRVVVDAASNPELWPFVLGTEIGDLVPFTRTPVGGAAVTGNFTVLSIEPDLGPDKAQFTYVLTPAGVF